MVDREWLEALERLVEIKNEINAPYLFSLDTDLEEITVKKLEENEIARVSLEELEKTFSIEEIRDSVEEFKSD